MLRMEAFAVMAIGDVDSLVSSDGMRIDYRRLRDTMLPCFLHLRMHNKQRIVRQVYRDLAFNVCSLVLRAYKVFIIASNYSTYTKFSGNAKADTPNDSSWTKISELVSMITYAFIASLVTVYEGGVRHPSTRRLVLELLRLRIEMLDSFGHFVVDGAFHDGQDVTHLRGDLANILILLEFPVATSSIAIPSKSHRYIDTRSSVSSVPPNSEHKSMPNAAIVRHYQKV